MREELYPKHLSAGQHDCPHCTEGTSEAPGAGGPDPLGAAVSLPVAGAGVPRALAAAGGLSWGSGASPAPRTPGLRGVGAAGKGSPRQPPTCSRPEGWSRGPGVGAGRPSRGGKEGGSQGPKP